jgi:hypothetical protein
MSLRGAASLATLAPACKCRCDRIEPKENLMRRYRRFRYGGPPIVRPWRPFRFLWLIIFVMFFFGGRWWPAILALIILGFVLETVFRARQGPPNPPPPPPPPMDANPYPMPTPMPTPAASMPAGHRTDLLPTNCPNCGAPVRPNEVKWTGAQSASCGYCGTNLPMKKQ